MFDRCLTILFSSIKVVAILVLLLSFPKLALAQSCCVDEPNCNPCEGGLSSITFAFNGDLGLLGSYSVRDINGPIQSGLLTGANITVNNSPFNQPFDGGIIFIQFFNILLNPEGGEVVISTSCSELRIGREYGDGKLKVLSAISPVSGPICCAPEDTDQVPPEFVNFPADAVISIEADCSVEYSWVEPTVIDDCGFAIILTPKPTTTQIFELGNKTITYTARDASGNIFTDSFTVTVIDEIPPVISNMPQNINRNANNVCEAVVSWPLPSATDNCQEVNLSPSIAPGSTFPLGLTKVTYTATDGSDNIVTSSFNVVVSDNTPPVFSSFPGDLTFPSDENCVAVVNWEIPEVTDNCNAGIVPVLEDMSPSPGATLAVGVYTVNYSAVDENENEIGRSFKVTVVDNSAPVFSSFPSDMRVPVGNSCEIAVTWETPVVEDNCNEANLELVVGSPESGDVFNLGTSMVTYKATDILGNEVIQSFEIEVVDDQAPVFSGCPQDRILSAGISCEARVDWEIPEATDNCELMELRSNLESGSRFPIGTTEVEYTAIDGSGNVSSCSFNITVTNDFEPVIENCPESVELELFDREGVRYEWVEPIIDLECATIVPESNYQSGDLFPEGRTEVRYFYNQNGEEVVVCSFIVEVELAEIEFEVPQLLTPNGDGENDVWEIDELSNFRNNTVTIVDRWGGEIYSAKGYNNESTVWDGSNQRGDLVPTGTYYYFITVEFESSVVKKGGFIELIR
jgi:gliding motility-associated-like protein